MPVTDEALRKRIDELLEIDIHGAADQFSLIAEALQGTITVARALYGDTEETPQVQTLMKAAQQARASTMHTSIAFRREVWPVVQGSLRAMRADLNVGLAGSLARQAQGEVLVDMLDLAKEALRETSEAAKNVAAVLAAATYEDTIRKMGAGLAGLQGRPELHEVLTGLKLAKVIEGPSVGTAQSYLKFRNDALHADWEKIDRAVVVSCITFVEQLILTHLS